MSGYSSGEKSFIMSIVATKKLWCKLKIKVTEVM
jgi:hypothetical protein